MRKISVLIVALCLAFVTAVTVSAASSVCAPDKKTAARGETVTVSVTLKNSGKVQTLGITPVFDTKVFELVSGKWTLSEALLKDFDEAKCRGALLLAEERDCNGEVFVLTLKVKNNAALGDTSVKAELILKDGDKRDVACGTVETKVTVTEKAGQTAAPPDASTAPESTAAPKDTAVPESTTVSQNTAVPDNTETPKDTAVYETVSDSTGIADTAGDSAGEVTAPVGTETDHVGVDKDFIGDGVLVDDPEDTGGSNKIVFVFAGIAIVLCLIIGWFGSSNKKR